MGLPVDLDAGSYRAKVDAKYHKAAEEQAEMALYHTDEAEAKMAAEQKALDEKSKRSAAKDDAMIPVTQGAPVKTASVKTAEKDAAAEAVQAGRSI